MIPLLASTLACTGDDFVNTNTPPTALITQPAGDVVIGGGELLEVEGQVHDAHQSPDTLVVRWESNRDGVLAEPVVAADGWTTDSFSLSPGEHTLALVAIDYEGQRGRAERHVTVEGSLDAPVVDLREPEADEPLYQGVPFEVVVQVDDRNDSLDSLELVVTSDTEGPLCNASIGLSGEGRCEGELGTASIQTLTATVTDPQDLTGADTVEVTVLTADEQDLDGDGYSEADGDCDETNPDIHPDAEEQDDDVDWDCDGNTNNGTDNFDDDYDGWTENEGDCDDSRSWVYPGATESCDELDADCDGSTNDEDSIGCTELYPDLDKDGYGDASAGSTCLCETTPTTVEDGTDCDDSDSQVNPGQTAYFGSATASSCPRTPRSTPAPPAAPAPTPRAGTAARPPAASTRTGWTAARTTS
jgi:hypothetical protein